ncbi:MAG: aspartate aminotransferase family protein, partial [Actinomycetota bacterium]
MTTNTELLARYRAALPSFVAPLHAEPISIDRGEGSYVWDVEGNRYLDWFGGVLTTMVGHSVPEVVTAVQEQAAKVMHTSTLYLSEPMIAFAEEVAAVSGIPDARVFFTASGTEANDTALMLACAHRRSNEILAMRNSYHGRSYSAQAITAQRSWSVASMSGLNVNFVHGGYRLRSPFRDLDDEAFTQACVADLVQIIDMATAGDVAAMIAEPIQGVGGFATPPDGFFGAMGKELDNRDILFISDEVQTGWGRTGEHFWGYQAHGIVPDMLTFAKGVGNGITLAGVVARAEIMDSIKVLSFSTFGGNPLSTAAGRATLRYVLDHDLQGNAKKMGDRLTERLGPVIDETDWIAELRGRGLMQ